MSKSNGSVKEKLKDSNSVGTDDVKHVPNPKKNSTEDSQIESNKNVKTETIVKEEVVKDSKPKSEKNGKQSKKPPPKSPAKPETNSKTKGRTKKTSKPIKVESPSWKITDFFQVRRSSRRTAAELKKEAENSVESKIRCGCEEGLKVVKSPVKGRGVIAEKIFRKGDFVVEYRGDLIDPEEAKQRETNYADDSSVGCYMYYFRFRNRSYCVDATAESGYLGRLVNHSAKKPNLTTKTVAVDGIPHLILVAGKDISVGDELLYDYGDRDKVAVQANPWLKST